MTTPFNPTNIVCDIGFNILMKFVERSLEFVKCGIVHTEVGFLTRAKTPPYDVELLYRVIEDARSCSTCKHCRWLWDNLEHPQRIYEATQHQKVDHQVNICATPFII